MPFAPMGHYIATRSIQKSLAGLHEMAKTPNILLKQGQAHFHIDTNKRLYCINPACLQGNHAESASARPFTSNE